MTLAGTAINETCPWSGDAVRPDSLTTYRGRTVGFCNPGCRDKFARATTMFDAAIAREPVGPTLMTMAGLTGAAPALPECTLVIIDAQGEYRSGPLALPGLDEALTLLASLLARARAAGTPIIHIAHSGAPGTLFDRQGPGGAILPEAAPADGEPIVEKTHPNAFHGTDLDARLRALGRPNLLLAGFMTHMCISATARAALDLGHRVTIAADAVATRALPDPFGGEPLSASEIHRASLAALSDRFAAIVRAEELRG